MQRLLPYLGIVTGLLLGVVTFLFTQNVTLFTASYVPPASTSTLSVVPNIPAPEVPALAPSEPTTTPTLAVAPSPKKKTIAPVSAPATTPAPAPAPAQADVSAGLSASAAALRLALVNVLCYAPAGSGLTSISGSGVFIDPKGIILTNAHVAQYFLLADRGVSCVIRSGGPAADKYKAQLIFISPAWLSANATVLTQTNPIGTGEHDIALLAVTKSATSDPLPLSFPALSLATVPPSANTPVVIGSYGAQFLESSTIQSSLFPTLVYGSVKNVYTFGTNTIDVLDLGGSAAAQEGSSGGGVVTADGELSGTIVTSTIAGDTSTRQLDAITASYVRADYASETGGALDALLSEPTLTSVAAFLPQQQSLESELTAQLP